MIGISSEWEGLQNADFRATDSGSAVSNVVLPNRWPISGPRLLGPLIRSGSPLVLDNGTISTLYHYQPGTRTVVNISVPDLLFTVPLGFATPTNRCESVAQGGAGH